MSPVSAVKNPGPVLSTEHILEEYAQQKLISFRVIDERKSLLYKVIALAELIYSLMDQILGNIVKAVRKIMQFLCMMTVVTEHICEQSKSLLR
jgi:hypothetical protein